MSSRKRVYAVHGDTTMPRKRFRCTSDSIPEPKFARPTDLPDGTATRRRRRIRVRRTPIPVEPMDIEIQNLHKRRSAHGDSSPRQAKRSRSIRRAPAAQPVIPTTAPRVARTPSPLTPTHPVKEPIIEEIIADGAGHVPPRQWTPPAPAVHAAMLEDGRVCVRIVRQNGIVQNVIIDNPQF